LFEAGGKLIPARVLFALALQGALTEDFLQPTSYFLAVLSELQELMLQIVKRRVDRLLALFSAVVPF